MDREAHGTLHPSRAAARSGRPIDSISRSREPWLAARREDGVFEFEKLRAHPDWGALVPLVERSGDPAEQLPRLAQYAALVLEWNRTVSNLISRGDERKLVSRHLRESIEPAAWMAETCSGGPADSVWLDFGSGAGFPALPLALYGIGREWVLVESRRPKVLFLRRALLELGLRNVTVLHARLESVASGEHGEPSRVNRFDGFTSRATITLAPTLELAARVVRPAGSAYLWKGSGREAELLDRSNWSDDWSFDGELALGNGPGAVCKFLRV